MTKSGEGSRPSPLGPPDRPSPSHCQSLCPSPAEETSASIPLCRKFLEPRSLISARETNREILALGSVPKLRCKLLRFFRMLVRQEACKIRETWVQYRWVCQEENGGPQVLEVEGLGVLGVLCLLPRQQRADFEGRLPGLPSVFASESSALRPTVVLLSAPFDAARFEPLA